jgi:hypothetical protein
MMFLVATLAALAAPAFALCDDTDAAVRCNRELLYFQAFPSVLAISGTSTVNGIFQSKIEFVVEVGGNGLDVTVNYQFRGGMAPNVLNYNFRMPAIIEFISKDDTAFDPQDEVEQIYDLRKNGTWNAWDVVNSTMRDGIQYINFTATTVDGVFAIVGHITDEVVYNFPSQGDTSNPNFIKFDFIMNDFPYVANGTSLAMVSCVSSGTGSQIATDHAQITIPPQTPSYLTGDVNWDVFVEVELAGPPPVEHEESIIATYGKSEKVNVCPESDPIQVYYSIENNERLKTFVWDPYVGVFVFPAPFVPPHIAPSSNGAVVGVIVTLGVLGLMGFVWWRRQHNKQSYGQMNDSTDPMDTY